jgi:hypothetical protein
MSNYDNTNKGIGFIQKNKTNEKAPDLKGKINWKGVEIEIAGWLREGKTGEFYSFTLSEPYQKSTLTDPPKQTTYSKPKDTGDLPF